MEYHQSHLEDKEITVGLAMTGSFCTFDKILTMIGRLKEFNMKVIPIFSDHAQSMDTRFGKAADFCQKVEELAGTKGIYTIPEAEPIGPKDLLDVLVIAPCTGNTLAKLATGITDTAVLMAAKAHLRNEKPLILSISTNDALSMNFKNIGLLMNMKHIFFVPFGQDNYIKKHNSMIACVDVIPDTIIEAIHGRQIQPVIRNYCE